MSKMATTYRPHERPLAAAPFHSYRYYGPYGWVMIGAMDDTGALEEARRSVENPQYKYLESWDDEANCYKPLDQS